MVGLVELCAEAITRPDGADVFEYEGHWYTWGELRAGVSQFHRILDACGAPGDAPVTLIARNRPWAVAALLALLAQGRTVRMVYAFQVPAGIARDIARLASPVVIAGEGDLSDEVLLTLRKQGAATISAGGMIAQSLAGLESVDPDFKFETPGEPHIAILTSGTTGPPKQFPVTYRMIEQLMQGGNARPGMPSGDKAPPLLLFMPMGNISGIYTVLPTLLLGMRGILQDRFTLDSWRAYVREYRPIQTGLPPAGVQMVLDAEVPVEELSCIRALGTGAAPLDPEVQRAFEERYGIPILLSYGATEFGGPVTAMTLDLVERWGKAKHGSVGLPIAGAQLRVVDPETLEEVPPGCEGLLEVQIPRMGQHWIRTSDIVVIDEDGFLFHRARADGAIMRGGFKVLPETIERALMQHPAISAAAVVGVADRRLGQVPGAAIQVKPGFDQPGIGDLDSHVRQHVLATHVPVHWRIVTALPKTPSFKIDRPALLDLFREVSADSHAA